MTDPVLRVVKGDPTPEELAALIAVISTRAVPAPASPDPRPSDWSTYWRTTRRPLHPGPGPGRWRASAHP